MYKEPDLDFYYSLREDIIKSSLLFCRKITTFAMLEELSDLQAMFCYSEQELSKVSDDKLIIISNLIINKLREFVCDMGEYDVDDTSIDKFFDLIDKFQDIIKNDKAFTQKFELKKFEIES